MDITMLSSFVESALPDAAGVAGGIFVLLIMLFVIAAVGILPLILCPVMANNRGRSAVAWFFVAFFAGWIGVIILACLGDE